MKLAALLNCDPCRAVEDVGAPCPRGTQENTELTAETVEIARCAWVSWDACRAGAKVVKSKGRSRMKTQVGLCVLGLGLLLTAGCGPKYWYQEGKTFEECRADRAACRAELLKRTDRERVGDYERRFMEDCMQQRGYQLVSEKDLPLDVKREEPDIPSEVPIARGYGVAGSLPK